MSGSKAVPDYPAEGSGRRQRSSRHRQEGSSPRPPPTEAPNRVTYSQLRTAASWDPTAFCVFWKINRMVCPPGEVYTDPDVVACTRETRGGTAPHRRSPRPLANSSFPILAK